MHPKKIYIFRQLELRFNNGFASNSVKRTRKHAVFVDFIKHW